MDHIKQDTQHTHTKEVEMIIKTNSGKEVISRLTGLGLLTDGGTETLFYVKHDFIVDGYDPEDKIDGLPVNYLYEQGDKFTYDDYEHIIQMKRVRLLLVGFQCFDESQDEAIPLSMHDLKENFYMIDERTTTAIVENETGMRNPAPCDKETDFNKFINYALSIELGYSFVRR